MNNKKNKIQYCALLFFSFFLVTSCLKENNQYQEREDQLIKTYLSTNTGYQFLNSGIYYKSITEGTGDTISSWSNLVIISYTATNLETKKIFDTSDKSIAKENSIENTTLLKTEGPLKIKLLGTNGFYAMGVCYGIVNMKEGGKASMVIPGSLALGSFTPIVVEVELHKIIKDPGKFEFEQIAHYLSNDSIKMTLADSTKDGIYFVKTTVDTSKIMPALGDSVQVNYSLRLLPYYADSVLIVPQNTIQTSQVFTLKLGTTSVIDGFANALLNIKVGGTATVVIPYHHGYKSEVMVEYNKVSEIYQLSIPQYSTLIYDLKVVKVYK